MAKSATVSKSAKSKSSKAKAPKAVKNVTKVAPEVTSPSVSLLLNKAGREMFGDAESVRFRVVGDVIQLRPTNRTKGMSNFTKGEKVLPLTRTTTQTKFSADIEVEPGSVFALEGMKYGWIALRSAQDAGRDVPTIRVASR